MKRDMDLIRQILIQTKDAPSYIGPPVEIEAADFSEEEISYHVMLLSQAGYIEVQQTIRSSSGSFYKPRSLTWAGHEFLDAALDDNLWNKAKSFMREKGGSMAFEVLRTFLMEAAKRQALDFLGSGSGLTHP